MKWKSKNIYWHKVIWIDKERIKLVVTGKYEVGKAYGFQRIEKEWSCLDNKAKDITPYIKFKYIGKSLYSDNLKERKKSFNKLNLITKE